MYCFIPVAVTLLALVHPSYQSTNNGIPAVLTMLAADVELNETQHRRIQLTESGGLNSTDPVLSCTPDVADSDPVRAYIQTVTPSTPCGRSCFSLEPCGSGGEFCLFYLPGVDTLDFTAAPQYTFTIGCTDDAEAPATASMTVTIISNTPPSFVPSAPLSVVLTINGSATPADTLIYEINTYDADTDYVEYTMSLSPASDQFHILNNGQIKAQEDLRFFCEDKITAEVTASDQHNPAIGPFTLELSLESYNAAPTVTNLDTTVSYREKPGAGYTVLELDTVDNTLFDTLNIHMWSDTSAGMDLYELSGTTLRTKLNPKYVREDIRSVTLHFLLDDGYCRSQTHSLTVEVENHNERPRIYTREPFLEAYEGEINVPQDIEIRDEEQADGFTYALSRSNSLFDVEASTGNIITKPGVSIDVGSNTIYEDFNVYIRAYDTQGRRSDEANFLVRVYDKNDNQPYFTQNTFNMAATECTELGSIVGQVTGQDDDSVYNQNNFFYFGGGGSVFVVMATGDVVLAQSCTDGVSYTGTATIQDQGIYPGALTGNPAKVTITCGPCPSTTATPADANATAAATTTTTTTRSRTTTEGTTNNFAWLAPTVVLGIAWLTLTVLLFLKFCSRCKNTIRVKEAPARPSRPMRTSIESRLSDVTTISLHSTENTESRDLRSSNGIPAARAVVYREDKPHMPIPPIATVKPQRKKSNPFLAWKNSPLTLYRRHYLKMKEQSQWARHTSKGLGGAKSLSAEPLPEVETISVISETRESIDSLSAIVEETPRSGSAGSRVRSTGRVTREGSLASILSIMGREGSKLSLTSSKRGSVISFKGRKGSASKPLKIKVAASKLTSETES